MRASSLTNPDVAFDREIDSTYDDIKAIADNIEILLAVNAAIQNDGVLTADSSVEDNLLSTDPTKILSANQGRVLKEFVDELSALLTSDDVNLNEIQEIITFIKTNRTMIETLTTEGMVKNVYDVLGTGVVDNAEKVNGLTVQTAVPLGALFTDTNTIYDDTAIQAEVAANTTKRTYPLADETKLAAIAAGAEVNIAETVTTLTLVGNNLTYTDENGTPVVHDLSLYLDDTNLARLISGVYNAPTQELIFTRDDATTFVIDASMFFDDSNLVLSVDGHTGVVDLSNVYEPKDVTILKDADIGVSVQAYEDNSIIAEDNLLDFIKKNFELTATAANITATGLTGTFPREGTILVHSAENVTGWGAEFKFKNVPTDLLGDETFAYFIEDALNIWIGRVQ